MFVQRKIESDDISVEDSKKLRTAEVGSADAEAGPVMGEGSKILTDDAATATGGSAAEMEDENHMSLDDTVKETTAAESTDLPASTASDVIDVDAIEKETSCDEAKKPDKHISNPHELGLNEYYLQPASDDQPTGDVIDVDAEATPAETAGDAASTADSGTAVIREETSCENQTSEVGATGHDKPDLEDPAPASVEVRSIVPAAAGASSSSVHEIELVVHPSTKHEDMVATDVDEVVIGVADVVTEVVDRAVASSDEAVAIHGQVFIETLEAGISLQPADEPAVETTVVSHAVPVKDVPSLGDMNEAMIKQVQDECTEGKISRDKGMEADSSETEVGKASTNKHAIPEGSDRNVTDAQSVEVQSMVSKTEQIQQISMDVNQPTKPVAEDYLSSSEDAVEKPDQDQSSEEIYGKAKVGRMPHRRNETDLVEPVKEEHSSVQYAEHASSELTEMTEKQVSNTEDKSQSVEAVDVDVIVSEDTKESAEVVVSDAATQNAEISQPLLVEKPVDATKVRDVTDEAGSGSETTTQLVIRSGVAENTGKLPDMVSRTGEIEQDDNQPTEAMAEADVSSSEDVTDSAVNDTAEEAVTNEEGVMQHKDVPDVVETSQQPMEAVAETNNGENIPECRETKDVAISDEKDAQQNADMTDRAKNDAAASDEMETDAVPEKSTDLTAKDAPVVLAADSEGHTDMTDKEETADETTELTPSRDSDALMKHSGKTAGIDTASMEVKTGDSELAAGELAANEDMETTVDPPTSASNAAP